MGHKSYNLLIVGYYFKKNYGDDLLLDVVKKLLNPKYIRGEFQINCKFFSTEDIKSTNQIVNDLAYWSDRVILFGGEVINSYFLDRLINLKNFALYELNKNIPFYAVGVSINEDIDSILPKIDLFETIIFRNNDDYLRCLPRLSNTYSKSLPDPVFLLKPKKNNNSNNFPRGKSKTHQYNVGYFLSQTANPSNEYIESVLFTIRYWFMLKARVFLFTMCYSDSPTESDIIINRRIFNELNYFEKENCVFLDNPRVINDYLFEIDFAICWRFHAHILCIQHQIPFLSISSTPKVQNLLLDNNLQYLQYTKLPIINGIDFLLEKRVEIKKQLDQINDKNYKLAQDYKQWSSYLFRERSLPRFYIDINNPKLFSNLEKYYHYINPITAEDKATSILYLITGKTKTIYHWGLTEKISAGIELQNLKKDIEWLIKEEIKNGDFAFYYKMANLLEIQSVIFPNKKDRFLNIHYIDQNDMRGVHRAGWQYVIDNIETELSSFYDGAILCDLYIDRTFHWNLRINKLLGIIPYKKHWIGFIHHTCNTTYSNFNIIELFNKTEFIESLVYCKALIVLSVYLRKQLNIIINRLGYNIPLFSLFHPTEMICESSQFKYNEFLNNVEKKVIQVGAWYRDIDAIYRLTLGQNPLKICRYALKGPNMESYYSNKMDEMQISRDQTIRAITPSKTRTLAYALEKPVQIINSLNCSDYDELFKKNIIFIRLIDASAVNTIIESIVRNTPILVNPLEPVVEYLGRDYPFYYNSLDEATKKINDPVIIRKTYFYLKKMDKSNLKIETFINSLKKLKIRHIV